MTAKKTSAATRLDQYYTSFAVAAYLYELFKRYFDPDLYLMVEPSAGTGAFFRLLPPGSLGYDIDPKYLGVQKADFLSLDIASDRSIAVIGNPPFGQACRLAIDFFNHAAQQAHIIAFILPRSFRKHSIQQRLDRNFHLVCDVDVPANAFVFESRAYDVPTCFQIWERRDQPREHRHADTSHPDFRFTTPDEADFAIQRIGVRAGQIHMDFSRSQSSHYFIQGKVLPVMLELDFASSARNAAGPPTLAKSEIVRLYRDRTERSEA